MKKLLLLMILCTLACAGKAVTTDTPARQDGREQELRGIVLEAEPLVAHLLDCLAAANYAGYVRDFDNSSRSAFTEEQFKSLQAFIENNAGPYEKGGLQVHKIEQYEHYYKIYYFVKFEKTARSDPVLLQVKIKPTQNGIKISGLSYQHAFLMPSAGR